MKSRYKFYLLVFVAFCGLALWSWLRYFRQPFSSSVSAARPQDNLVAKISVSPGTRVFLRKSATSKTPETIEVRKKITNLLEFSTSSNFQLEIMRNGLKGLVDLYPALKLSDKEFQALVDEVTEFQRVSGEFKAEAAIVKRSENGGIEVTTPSNPSVAQELSEMFLERLAEKLSVDRAVEIDSILGKDLVCFFYGYGAADEKFVFTPSVRYSGTFDFTHSANVPDEFLKNGKNFLHSQYAGSDVTIPSSQLQEIINYPQYSFLIKLIKG